MSLKYRVDEDEMIRVPRYKYYFAISDFFILSVSFFSCAYFLTRNSSHDDQSGLLIQIMVLFAVLTSTIIYTFSRNQLYQASVILKKNLHINALTKSLLLTSGIIFLVFILFYLDSFTALGMISLLSVFSSALLFYIVRLAFYKQIISKVRNELLLKNVVILGAGKSGSWIAESLAAERSYDINVVGFLDDFKAADSEITNGRKVLGRIDEIKTLSEEFYIDEAVLAIDNITYDRLLEILDQFRNSKIELKITSRQFQVVSRFSKEACNGVPLIGISSSTNKIFKISKRIMDFFGALAGILLISPILMLISLLIKITSKGPVIFRQTRIGYNGKPFNFYKFRSMYLLDGEDEVRKKNMIEFMKKNHIDSDDKKVINDFRVTWIGKYIRKTSLDELPQLFNVLKGDMSLVGPRPCLPYEYDNYDKWQKRRVDILPGCTGVWQVSGRSTVSFDDSVLMDIYYINNLSFFFDMRILLKTLPVMFFSKGGR